jgi:hypothetical protein
MVTISDKRQVYLFARSQLWLVAPTTAVETTSENLTTISFEIMKNFTFSSFGSV